MWSNTELSELQRVREKQHDAESTDEAVVELVVISCDFRAQTGQAIITVVDRVTSYDVQRVGGRSDGQLV